MGLDATDAVATTSSQTRKRARSLSRGDGEEGEESAAKRARSRSTSRLDLSLHDDKVCFLLSFLLLLLLLWLFLDAKPSIIRTSLSTEEGCCFEAHKKDPEASEHDGQGRRRRPHGPERKAKASVRRQEDYRENRQALIFSRRPLFRLFRLCRVHRPPVLSFAVICCLFGVSHLCCQQKVKNRKTEKLQKLPKSSFLFFSFLFLFCFLSFSNKVFSGSAWFESASS